MPVHKFEMSTKREHDLNVDNSRANVGSCAKVPTFAHRRWAGIVLKMSTNVLNSATLTPFWDSDHPRGGRIPEKAGADRGLSCFCCTASPSGWSNRRNNELRGPRKIRSPGPPVERRDRGLRGPRMTKPGPRGPRSKDAIEGSGDRDIGQRRSSHAGNLVTFVSKSVLQKNCIFLAGTTSDRRARAQAQKPESLKPRTMRLIFPARFRFPVSCHARPLPCSAPAMLGPAIPGHP